MRKTDKQHTTVQMEEKKSKEERQHDLEEPFNEEFWLKVRYLLLPSPISALLCCFVVCFDSQNVTSQSFSSILLPLSRSYFMLSIKK